MTHTIHTHMGGEIETLFERSIDLVKENKAKMIQVFFAQKLIQAQCIRHRS